MNNRLLYDKIYVNKLDPTHIANEVGKTKKSKLLDLLQSISQEVTFDETQSTSNFDLVANSSMSGLESQCHGLNCKVRRLNNLIRKATLYANKVWIVNPLEKYEDPNKFSKLPVALLREMIMDDIYILNHYKPLIESGLFAFAKTQNHFCLNCFKAISQENKINEDVLNKVKTIKKEIKTKHAKGADFFVKDGNERHKYVVEILNCNQDIFEHEQSYIGLNKLPKEYENAYGRKTKRIYQKEMLKSKDNERFANRVIRNIVLQNWYSSNYGANYVTDQTVEMNAINKLNNLSTGSQMENYFSGIQHTLPILTNVRLDKLIELRTKEPEAFINYRNSLDRFLNSHKENSSSKEINEAFRDEIQPHIDQLTQTINANRGKLVKNTITSLVVGSSIVGVSMFSGLLPLTIAQAVSGLAGFHQGSKLIENLIKLGIKEHEQKDNKYYFLWKAMQ